MYLYENHGKYFPWLYYFQKEYYPHSSEVYYPRKIFEVMIELLNNALENVPINYIFIAIIQSFDYYKQMSN